MRKKKTKKATKNYIKINFFLRIKKETKKSRRKNISPYEKNKNCRK